MIRNPYKWNSRRVDDVTRRCLAAVLLLYGGLYVRAHAESPPLFAERLVPISVVPKNATVVRNSFLASPDSRRVGLRIVMNNTFGANYPVVLIDKNRTSITTTTFGPTFSPDSRSFALVTSEGRGGRLYRQGSEPPLAGPDPVAAPVFSPDSKRLAYVGREGTQNLVFVDGRAGMVRYHEILANSLVFSGDSQHFVYAARRGKAWYMVLNGQESSPFAQVGRPVFSDNSQRIAYWAKDAVGSWVVVVDGQVNTLMIAEKQAGLRFSPDSTTLVAIGKRHKQWHVYVDGRIEPGHDALGQDSLTFSPNSKHLAYAVQDDGRWKVMIDGFPVGDYEALLAGSLRFSPDSSVLAYVAKDASGWFAVTNNSRHRSFDQIAAGSLQFSPDSHRFAYVARHADEHVSVIVDGYRWAACDWVEDLKFSPDSTSVAWVERHGHTSRVVIDGVEGGYEFDRLVSGASLVFDGPNRLHTVVLKRPGPVFFRYEADLYPDTVGESDRSGWSTTQPSGEPFK